MGVDLQRWHARRGHVRPPPSPKPRRVPAAASLTPRTARWRSQVHSTGPQDFRQVLRHVRPRIRAAGGGLALLDAAAGAGLRYAHRFGVGGGRAERILRLSQLRDWVCAAGGSALPAAKQLFRRRHRRGAATRRRAHYAGQRPWRLGDLSEPRHGRTRGGTGHAPTSVTAGVVAPLIAPLASPPLVSA